ncbi:hypothetical protein [Aquimarina mytili]|uniref:Uncharacterized protein n=1 Tax=Aquimarina mytili TaxID=874423 RepID=A0A936ZW47_9FLAO|nr:hypothetical protein [Aquimarina mytili]MBL0683316.1 hypothetical protein [Aquimarina mytili]
MTTNIDLSFIRINDASITILGDIPTWLNVLYPEIKKEISVENVLNRYPFLLLAMQKNENLDFDNNAMKIDSSIEEREDKIYEIDIYRIDINSVKFIILHHISNRQTGYESIANARSVALKNEIENASHINKLFEVQGILYDIETGMTGINNFFEIVNYNGLDHNEKALFKIGKRQISNIKRLLLEFKDIVNPENEKPL